MIPVLRARIGMLDPGNVKKQALARDVEARKVLTQEELERDDICNPGGEPYLALEESSTLRGDPSEWDAMQGL